MNFLNWFLESDHVMSPLPSTSLFNGAEFPGDIDTSSNLKHSTTVLLVISHGRLPLPTVRNQKCRHGKFPCFMTCKPTLPWHPDRKIISDSFFDLSLIMNHFVHKIRMEEQFFIKPVTATLKMSLCYFRSGDFHQRTIGIKLYLILGKNYLAHLNLF